MNSTVATTDVLECSNPGFAASTVPMLPDDFHCIPAVGNKCDPPCSQGATCDGSWGYPRCVCPTGFVGVDCSIRKISFLISN